MGYVVTATFQSVEYVACHTAFEQPFKQQIDVAYIGFRPNDGSNTIIVFPSMSKALEWGQVWFRRNKRIFPGLSQSFFTAVEVTVEDAE